LFCFVVYYLGHHPEVVQRLRQELNTVLGKDLTKPITYNDFDELRHCPVTYAITRMNAEKDEVGGSVGQKKLHFEYFTLQ
jgi:cytochrome P450